MVYGCALPWRNLTLKCCYTNDALDYVQTCVTNNQCVVKISLHSGVEYNIGIKINPYIWIEIDKYPNYEQNSKILLKTPNWRQNAVC